MKVLIDTCIVIDALQNRVPFSENAQKIFLLVAEKQFCGYITAKSLSDIYYITHKATHDDKTTRNILLKLLSLFCIADTTADDCRKAISSPVSDYEDAIMIESALREKMDYIVTRNITDYTRSSVPILDPEKFLILF